MRRLYALGIAYLFLVAGLVAEDVWAGLAPIKLAAMSHRGEQVGEEPVPSTAPANLWFTKLKPRCNAVEVEVTIKRDPPPTGRDGAAFSAACYALAGKIETARSLIEHLPDADRSHAARIVFNIAHPVADEGDDESAGPIMELVVEFDPGNYQALYHAGMSEFMLGEHEKSGVHMRRFLELYHNDDGFRDNAEKVLRRLAEAR